MEFREWVEENRQSLPLMKGTSLKSITPPQAAGVLKTLIKEEIRIYVGVR